MPEFDQKNIESVRKIIVNFVRHEDVDDFAKLIGQNITDKTRYVTHPKQDQDSTVTQRFVAAP